MWQIKFLEFLKLASNDKSEGEHVGRRKSRRRIDEEDELQNRSTRKTFAEIYQKQHKETRRNIVDQKSNI